MQSVVTITLKSEDSTFKKQFNSYDSLLVSEDCPYLNRMLDEAKSEFKMKPDEIRIKIDVEWVE
jgi:hypothetical protein